MRDAVKKIRNDCDVQLALVQADKDNLQHQLGEVRKHAAAADRAMNDAVLKKQEAECAARDECKNLRQERDRALREIERLTREIDDLCQKADATLKQEAEKYERCEAQRLLDQATTQSIRDQLKVKG